MLSLGDAVSGWLVWSSNSLFPFPSHYLPISILSLFVHNRIQQKQQQQQQFVSLIKYQRKDFIFHFAVRSFVRSLLSSIAFTNKHWTEYSHYSLSIE